VEEILDLSIIFTSSDDASTKALASVRVRCDALELAHTGNLFANPLTDEEREDLRWYLEMYWKWPYEGFAMRERAVEGLLCDIGQRLYWAMFGSQGAHAILQAWQRQGDVQRQISVVCSLPDVLQLPWELLHDGQEFLILRSSSLVRRLPLQEKSRTEPPSSLPLRVLLVTARPENVPFVDPRGIARELLDEVQDQVDAGTIELEFLRPPTWEALYARLQDVDRPIHVLHFDGHGVFDEERGEGELALEDAEGNLHLVGAGEIARALRNRGVSLVVLTACESAKGTSKSTFSSVAVRLIEGGIDGVVAMSSTVLITSITRYVEAFYRALAAGYHVSAAHEQAQCALAADPHRHLNVHHADEEGQPVVLHDWWVPQLYQQRPLAFLPAVLHHREKSRQTSTDTLVLRLGESMPDEPRYGFSGRSRELLQLERWLLSGRVVVVHGFGGIGKTALAREAADWLTRTALYAGACFVSFEHGGDACMLLSMLGTYLTIFDGHYNPYDITGALDRLKVALGGRRILIIADNLESILTDGEAPLEPEARSQLWGILLELAKMGAGVVLTSRDIAFDDPRLAQDETAKRLLLKGLHPEDAYLLAVHLLSLLDIDRQYVPYAQLRDLLAQLDHHPLAIQLVLPVLRTFPIESIQQEFATLLPQFADDALIGHNRSLSASLAYSLQRLSAEHRAYLPRLAIFEGGALEGNFLTVTEIPADEWNGLRQALRRAALLIVERVHAKVGTPYLHLHPVFVPYLRSQLPCDDAAVHTRYVQCYHLLARVLYDEDTVNPQPVRASIRRELPNLRRVMLLLLEAGDLDAAVDMAERLTKFLLLFGMEWAYAAIQHQVEQALRASNTQEGAGLTHTQWVRQASLGEDELERGDVPAAFERFSTLLALIETLPEEAPLGRGSYEHGLTLRWLARCLNTDGQAVDAEERMQQALDVVAALHKQTPEDRDYFSLHGRLKAELGDILAVQGRYPQAQASYEEALDTARQLEDQRSQALDLGRLGALALLQEDYQEAHEYYAEALDRFREQKEPAMEAALLHEPGRVAEEQEQWEEAERYYRASLQIREQRLSETAEAADTCNQLALVAEGTGRIEEAERWLRHALEIARRVTVDRSLYATLLNNLTGVLVHTAQGDHAQATRARLPEAQGYAEQALAIRETLDPSEEIWKTLWLLASIAELEGRTEDARSYHLRERETFAAFEGNRLMIDHQFGPLIADIVAAALGNIRTRKAVEASLYLLEAEAPGQRTAAAIHRIWKGERDASLLVEGLDRESALLIQRVIDTLSDMEAKKRNAPHHLISLVEAKNAAAGWSERLAPLIGLLTRGLHRVLRLGRHVKNEAEGETSHGPTP